MAKDYTKHTISSRGFVLARNWSWVDEVQQQRVPGKSHAVACPCLLQTNMKQMVRLGKSAFPQCISLVPLPHQEMRLVPWKHSPEFGDGSAAWRIVLGCFFEWGYLSQAWTDGGSSDMAVKACTMHEFSSSDQNGSRIEFALRM